MPDMNRALDWLHQVEDDLLWANDTLKAKRFAQACFVCQLCGEKALKAIALNRGFDRIKSHSILDIARALEINGDIETAAKKLDLYYLTTRYPDALPSGAPFDFFTREQAQEALGLATSLVDRARAEFRDQTT